MELSLESFQQLIIEGYSICTDSRLASEKSLFFALKGESHNGNDFALEALKNGCKYAIIDEKISKEDKRLIKVDNVLSFLHKIAKNHRKQFNIPVFTITGSNGKTTTKELISKVLSEKYNVLSTKGNLNNHIGAPLTILQLNPKHQCAVIEIGANQPGEIKMLSDIICPTHGIITNIGKAHLEGFNDIETIIENKAALYESLINNDGVIFQRGENRILKDLTGNYLNVITYGDHPSDMVEGNIRSHTPYLTIDYKNNCNIGKCKIKSKSTLSTQITGSFNFENILAAITTGLYFGIHPDNINNAISSYVPENSRSQVIKTENNLILLDAYNANPTSMLASLESFLSFGHEPKTIILGDMLEMGKYAESEHEKIIKWINGNNFNKVILIGDVFYSFRNKFDKYTYFKNVHDASSWITNNPVSGNSILIKGSRGIKLEVILDYLS